MEGKETRAIQACTWLLCIYCTELVVKPHDDLMMGGMNVNTAPGVFRWSLKGELCSHDEIKRCKSQREQSGTKKKKSHTPGIKHRIRFSVSFNDSSLQTAEFAFFNTSSSSSSWVDVRPAPSPFRSCTNRLVPQTWLLKGWILWTAPVSLKHLFSQCWKMNTMFVCFVVHFNLCFDYC